MTVADKSLSLTIDLPSGKTLTREFKTDEPIMVGSGGSAHLKIDDEDVSSLHCMLKPVGEQLVVLDLGSDEGTEVNGKEITGETPIKDSDVIKIGETRIAVHVGGDMLAPTVPIRKNVLDENIEKTVKAPPPVSMATAQDTAVGNPTDATAPMGEATASEQPQPAAAPVPAVPASAKKHEKTELIPERQKAKATAAAGHGHGSAMTKSGDLKPDLGQQEKASDKGHVDITMMWGGSVMGVQRIDGSGSITIGDGKNNAFQVSDTAIPSLSFELVNLSKAGAVINIANGMQLLVDGQPVQGNKHTLDLNQRVVVRVGAVEFVIQYSKRYRAIDLGLFQTLDYLYSKIFALALILQVGVISAFLITPEFAEDNEDDLLANLNEFQALILTPPEKKKEKKQDLSGKKGGKAKEKEGLFGKKDKPKEDKLASKKGAPTVDKDKREEDRKIAMDALAALGLSGPKGAVSNVFGPGGLGSGINNALGGLKGTSMGDAGGAGGLGSRGTGAGGGGNGLGIGGIGSGTGRGSGGRGGVDLGGRGKGMTRIRPGKVVYKGSLSREEIQRVIRRVMSQIKYCYEKELSKEPNLQGKIVANWTIAGTGLVSTAKAAQNTMGNKNVERCVVRIIKRLRFPKPKGGGNVFVTYPFVFSSSG